ncbi:MAG: flagellin [Nitrospirae bacterium]|uniref:flagellin N-terminal helical domain-containing protein n=1 Tax=Candidatus Magnetobacterium casense TaxID=1455061 RepID=UPI00058F5A4D|nr:flagellin [Candidatus Magnetobacterium casensis]MBF0338231.1 flagellin [Nitrospirota bacterium]
MAFVIQTNVMSLNAQRNLRKTQPILTEAMQRLSSGYRINAAKDDAAGLAIATRMTTQTRGLTVSVRNANDGLSIAQTAEGAMDEITNNLQRIRELAVQAMSGQYGVTDVSYMQNEVNALIEEIGRTAEQTKFNDRRLLGGMFNTRLHVSYAASDAGINVIITSMNTDALGGKIFTSTGKNGAMAYLKDIHSATTVGVAQVGDNSFVSVDGAAPTWSYTANASITYSGIASLYVADSTSVTGWSSRASNAIAIIDGALNTVLSEKAKLGAKANQMEAIVRNLDNVLETTYSARSRIMDADFALETSNMTKGMILQQSGISILAQANSQQQNILALLR